jgi:signal transduction histidine kinase/DNA-binding response OmpR family regulator
MNKLRILHLEDNPTDASLVRSALQAGGVEADVVPTSRQADYLSALDCGGLDVILVDNGVPGFSGTAALEEARKRCPEVPVILVSGTLSDTQAANCLQNGAADFVLKDQLWQLRLAITRCRTAREQVRARLQLERHNRAMARLVAAVQELSLARNLESVMTVVRRAARELTGADGATFVLREADKCYYADENAIAPLWKGQRFPMSACISGWAMLNRQCAVIEDIYADPRIPADAYRPTFVKSLVMVPIRTDAPVGAIGNYWASRHRATAEEVELLQALANTTAVAIEDVQLLAELEQRVADRTLQLEAANKELEAFSYSVSHDLRAPLRAISGFSELLETEFGSDLSAKPKEYLHHVREQTRRMGRLIEDLLRLARFARTELRLEKVDLSEMAQEIGSQLAAAAPRRNVEFQVQPGVEVEGDRGLLRVVLENLLANAWKYTARREHAVVEFGTRQADGVTACFVRDNGAGFDMRYVDRLFAPFQRLHSEDEFPGIGVGLATVQRIVHRHRGRIWVEAQPDKGATFYFTIPQEPKRS